MDIKSYAPKQMTFFRNSETKRFEFLDKKVGYRWIQSEELKQEPICYMIKFTQSQGGDEEFSLSLGRFYVLESELPYINYEKFTRLYHGGSLPQYVVASCQTYQKAILSEYSYKYHWSTSSNEKLTAFHNAVYGDYVDIGENQFSFPLDEPVESELKELFDCIQRTREDWAISMMFEMEVDRKGLGEIESKQDMQDHKWHDEQDRFSEITKSILGCCFDVSNTLGSFVSRFVDKFWETKGRI